MVEPAARFGSVEHVRWPGGDADGRADQAHAVPCGLVVVTDRRQSARPLVDVVRAAVDGGARWVLLRERDLPHQERLDLAGRLRAVLAAVGGTLLVAGPDPLGGYAVHLAAAGPYPPPALSLVGRSCHDTAELGRLSTEDYVTLSPVFPTPSKPGYGPALRPEGLARLVRHTPVPVLGLGGIGTPEQARSCVLAGAVGVAVMGAVMRAADPVGLVRDLCAAVEAVVPEHRSQAENRSRVGGSVRGWAR